MSKVWEVTWGKSGATERLLGECYDLLDAIEAARQFLDEHEGTAVTAEVETASGLRLAGDDLF